MKKTIPIFMRLLVLSLFLFDQFSIAGVASDSTDIVIDESAASWFLSGDLNDDNDDLIGVNVKTQVAIHARIYLLEKTSFIFNGLSILPEARAPPRI